jgi:hypothetical protein
MPGGITKEEIIAALACCILRAENASGAPVDTRNGIYWHTREACLPIARKHGIPWTDVLREAEGTWHLSRSVIRKRSSPFWVDVAHPGLIVREVMES